MASRHEVALDQHDQREDRRMRMQEVQAADGIHVFGAALDECRDVRTPGTRNTFGRRPQHASTGRWAMNNIVYIVGAVVIVLVILGFLGLR